MLGELIGEFKGKIIGMRVLPIECNPKMESSFRDVGKILSIDLTDIGTFWSLFEEDGIYGEGQGILTTNDGEIVTWTAQGIGKMKGKGAEYRGSVFFTTSSNKFENLNNTMGVFEYSIDDEGHTHEKIWEWK